MAEQSEDLAREETGRSLASPTSSGGTGSPSSDPAILSTVAEIYRLLQKDDAEEDVDYEARELLGSSRIYRVHDYASMGDRPVGTYDCGSVEIENTPEVMYRALFLFRPEAVSFKDMYKGSLFTLVSPDYGLVASIEFFKYEIGLYFSAAREHISGTRGSCVISGMPGADNGIHYTSKAAVAWFGLLTDLLKRKWMVYSGNDFQV